MKRIGIVAAVVAALVVTLAPSGTALKTYALAMQLYDRTQPYRIGINGGGSVFGFIEDFEELRASGRLVVIDGLCISACTMITGLIPIERVCVTPFAQLAFHSATQRDEHSVEGTRILWNIYPEPVRQMLRDRGWDGDPKDIGKPAPAPKKGEKAATPVTNEHRDLIYIGVEDLRKIYRAC